MIATRDAALWLVTGLTVVMVSTTACDTTAPPMDDEPLLLSASAEVQADTVIYRLAVKNNSNDEVTLNWGGCIPEIGALLSVHDLADALRWDELEWRRDGGCYPVGLRTSISPGDDWSLQRRVAVRSILGDSLPPGQYRMYVTPGFVEDVPNTPLDAGGLVLDPS